MALSSLPARTKSILLLTSLCIRVKASAGGSVEALVSSSCQFGLSGSQGRNCPARVTLLILLLHGPWFINLHDTWSAAGRQVHLQDRFVAVPYRIGVVFYARSVALSNRTASQALRSIRQLCHALRILSQTGNKSTYALEYVCYT